MDIEYGANLAITDVKASDAGFEVTGYASTFGNMDAGGDVMMRGAFDHTLASGRPVRFLNAHRLDQVIGVAKSLKPDDKGLLGTFKISKTSLGEDVHTLLKDGALDSFSIGYIPTDVEFDDAGTRLLKSVDLLEVSVVALPMNDRATVTRVKSKADQLQDLMKLDTDEPFEDLLAQIAGWTKTGANAADALLARRAAEQRKLSDGHLDAIAHLLAETKDSLERFDAILRAHRAAAEAQAGDMKLRWELRRRVHAWRATGVA